MQQTDKPSRRINGQLLEGEQVTGKETGAAGLPRAGAGARSIYVETRRVPVWVPLFALIAARPDRQHTTRVDPSSYEFEWHLSHFTWRALSATASASPISQRTSNPGFLS
jgi:hypothetical protein